jgi:hypothetical protein
MDIERLPSDFNHARKLLRSWDRAMALKEDERDNALKSMKAVTATALFLWNAQQGPIPVDPLDESTD